MKNKQLKEYNLEISDNCTADKRKLIEYILSCHYEDNILTAGACAYILNVSKFEFQTKILNKYGIDYMEEEN